MMIAPWLPPSILAVLLWGVSMFLPKLAIRGLPPVHMTIYFSSFFMAGAIVLQGFYGFHVDFDVRGVLLAMTVGVLGGIAQILYNRSLRTSSVTYSVVITSLYPAVATLLAFLILHEALTLRQTAGIILGVFSLILMVKASDRKTEGE
jgi:drug/metabolite transporter (DMT)-like permease